MEDHTHPICAHLCIWSAPQSCRLLADESTISPGIVRPIARHRGHCAYSGAVRLSGALGVITCWANTRVGVVVNVMHSAHIAREPRSWIEMMGANLEVGRKVGAVRHFRSRALLLVSAALMKAPLFRK